MGILTCRYLWRQTSQSRYREVEELKALLMPKDKAAGVNVYSRSGTPHSRTLEDYKVAWGALLGRGGCDESSNMGVRTYRKFPPQESSADADTLDERSDDVLYGAVLHAMGLVDEDSPATQRVERFPRGDQDL